MDVKATAVTKFPKYLINKIYLFATALTDSLDVLCVYMLWFLFNTVQSENVDRIHASVHGNIPTHIPDGLAGLLNGFDYIPFPSNAKMAEEILNCCLESVIHWMKANNLKLNLSKMTVMLARKKISCDPGDCHSAVEKVALTLKKQVPNLRALLDPALHLDAQL